MREKLSIEVVSPPAHPLRMSVARQFLASFGCELHEGNVPVRLIRRGGRIVGASQVLCAPLHMTWWAPGAGARSVIEGIDALRIAQEAFTPGGVTYCSAHDGGAPFTRQVMEKLGFEDTGLRIFRSVPDFNMQSKEEHQ